MNRIAIALLLAASTACMGQQKAKPDPPSAGVFIDVRSSGTAKEKLELSPPRAEFEDFRVNNTPVWQMSRTGTTAEGVLAPETLLIRYSEGEKVMFEVRMDGSVYVPDPSKLDRATKDFWRMVAQNYQLACKQNPKE